MENVAEVYDERATIQRAMENFAAFLDDADYATVLDIMGIGRLQFLLRRQMTCELKGLYTALWRLAVAKSFPGSADAMFAHFLNQYALTRRGKAAAMAMERAEQYWGMLEPAGDSDFNGVARHLISFVVKDQQDTRAITLKIALHLRSCYRTIFEHLI